jgi:hypothetical protein
MVDLMEQHTHEIEAAHWRTGLPRAVLLLQGIPEPEPVSLSSGDLETQVVARFTLQ